MLKSSQCIKWSGLLAFAVLSVLPQVRRPLCAQDYHTYATVQHPEQFDENWALVYQKMDDMTRDVRSVVPHKLDIAYGSDKRQRLDVYFPNGTPKGVPVFMFIHGGGFREGDRANYGFIAKPFVAHGYVTVIPSYRLTENGFYYPSQPEDMHRALEWIYRNIAQYGGDPNRIYVGGHSVGGILTEEVCVRGHWLIASGLPKNLIKGCAPVSASIPVGDPKLAIGGGIYAKRQAEGNAYDHDPAHRDEANPLLNIDMAPPRAIFIVGSEEPVYHESARLFVKELTARGTKAEFLLLPGFKHSDTVLGVGNENSPVFQAILKTFGN